MTPVEFYASSDALAYTGKSQLNTLARAVEQLAGCLAQQAKLAVEVKVQQAGNASVKG